MVGGTALLRRLADLFQNILYQSPVSNVQPYDAINVHTILRFEPKDQGRANYTDRGDSDGRKVVEGPMGRIRELG